VTKNEIENYLLTLTSKELEYYDIQNDRIPETFIFAMGAWDSNKLVGIGGLAMWYGVLPHAFYMIKEAYQGNRLGSKFADLNVEFAKDNKLPFITGSAKVANTRSISIVKSHGYKKVWSDGENYFSILLLNRKYWPVKLFLRVMLPLYNSPLGNAVKVFRRGK
jgi:RimJ/RimL family protein N-acetyltransferase